MLRRAPINRYVGFALDSEAVQQNNALFNHIVDAGQEGERHGEAEARAGIVRLLD